MEYYFILVDRAFLQCCNKMFLYTTAYNIQQGVALCLPAFSVLCYTCTQTHTVAHAHFENPPLADRRQSLFVSDWDYTIHQQQGKADVKAVWISVIKRVTVPMLPVTQVEDWKCLGIPSFPFWSLQCRLRYFKIPNWPCRTLWRNLFHFQ